MAAHNLEFHNVAGLENYHGLPGVFLPRYPAKVRAVMSEGGAGGGEDATGVELRFVTDTAMFRLSFTALAMGEVDVFSGDFHHSRHSVQAGSITSLNLSRPERYSQVRPEMLVTGGLCSGSLAYCL